MQKQRGFCSDAIFCRFLEFVFFLSPSQALISLLILAVEITASSHYRREAKARVLSPHLEAGVIINDGAALPAFSQDLHRIYQGHYPQAISCLAGGTFIGTDAADLQRSLAEGSVKVKNLHGLKEGRGKFVGTGTC